MPYPMTAQDMADARRKLGALYGLDRSLLSSELAWLLRLGGAVPANMVQDWERGKSRISGPVSLAIDLLIEGGWRNHPIPHPKDR